MKEGWEYKKLIDVCDVYQPKTISTSKLVNNGPYYVYGANGIIGKYINFNHEESEVLLTCRGASCGNINVSKPKSWINGNAMVIHPLNEKITKEYLSYYLKVIDYSKVITGAAQPQITRSSLSDTFILYPSIDEQRRIVSYLDSSFKLIDEIKNKALKSLTEAKALFQSALTEAMEPKEGWEEKTLGEISLIVGRIGFRGYTRKDIVTNKKDGAITLSPSNIVNGNMCYNNCTYISWFKYNESPEIKIQNGDILIVKTGSSYGKSAFVENLPHKATINPQFVVLKDIKINHKFLSYQLKTKKTYDYINSIVSGSAIPTFSQANLSKMLIGFPPLSTQKQIVSHLDKLSSKVRAIEEKYQKMVEECDALKQAMLRDVFE